MINLKPIDNSQLPKEAFVQEKEIVDLCDDCIYCKKRNVQNCPIQQQLHINDVMNETVSFIKKCKKYTKI